MIIHIVLIINIYKSVKLQTNNIFVIIKYIAILLRIKLRCSVENKQTVVIVDAFKHMVVKGLRFAGDIIDGMGFLG